VIDENEQRRFETFGPRRLSVFRQGYSLFVRVLKLTLPLAALALVGIVLARLSDSGTQLNLAAQGSADKTAPGQIELVQPKYEGTDAEGRPYTVTAEKAVRDEAAPDTVTFTRPEADITLTDKSWLAAKADGGALDHLAETLTLAGNVRIFHDSGYELKLQEIVIDLRQQTAEAAAPVTAQGPAGTLTAQSMTVRERGGLVVFGGPAKLTLYALSGGKGRG
jgi:lipopolysaccharide export system protein LptC